MIKHNYGTFFKKQREKVGKTQKQAAKALGFTSNGQYISNIEAGKCMVPARKVKALARVYKIKPEVIVNAMAAHYRTRIMKNAGLTTK